MTTQGAKLFGQIILLISVFSWNFVSANNLIQNPSFEQVDLSRLPIAGTITPKFNGAFPGLPNWFSAINVQGDMTTPDVYVRSRDEVPDNFATLGLQPVHGHNYAGIRSNGRGFGLYTEILEGAVTEPDFKKGDTVNVRAYFSTASSSNHRGTSTMQMWLKRANTNSRVLAGQISLQDRPSTWIFYGNEMIMGADGFFDRLSFNFSASSNNNLNCVFVDSVSLKVRRFVPVVEEGDNEIISTDTDTLLCSGSEFYIYFDYEFDNLTANTRFIAQLSDKNGSFLNPRIIGTAINNTVKIIRAKIPISIEPGTNYRVRIISQNPDAIGPESGAITILASPNPSISGGEFRFCLPTEQTYSTEDDPSYSYFWSVSGTGTILGSNDGPNVELSWSVGTGSLMLQVTSNESCQTTITESVVVRPINAQIYGEELACQNDTLQYITPFSPDYDYTWTAIGGTIVEDGGTSVKVIWDSDGLDTLTLDIIDESSSCTATSYIVVDVKPLPSSEISGSFSICASSSQSYSVEETAGLVYLWEIENGEIDGENNQSMVNVNWSDGQSGKIIITVTNPETGCESSSEVLVGLDSQVDLTFLGSFDPCANTSAIYSIGEDLAALTGLTFDWLVEGSKTFTISDDGESVEVDWGDFGENGTVTLIAQGDGMCFGENPITVTIRKRGDANFINESTEDELCAASVRTYSSTITDTDFNFYWETDSNGEIIGPDTERTVEVDWHTAGTGVLYLVVSGDGNVCVSSSSFSVTINENPIIDFGESVFEVCAGNSTEISILNGENLSYVWSSDVLEGDELNDTLFIADGGVGDYTLTVMNSNGCTASETFSIVEREFNIELFSGSFGELDFDRIIIGNDSTMVLEIINDTIRYRIGEEDLHTYFSTNKLFGGTMPYDSLNIEMSFAPMDIGSYSSTFKIVSTYPCIDERIITVNGKGMAQLEFILPGGLQATLNRNVEIPITYKLLQNASLPIDLEGYELDFQMPSDVLDSDDPSFFLDGKFVRFEISENHVLDANEGELIVVNGLTLQSIYTTNDMDFVGDIIVGNEFIIPIPIDGTIIVSDDCVSEKRRVEFAKSSSIEFVSDGVEISVARKGNYHLVIYNTLGMKQLEHSFSLSSRQHTDIRFPLSGLSSGVYFAILKSPEGLVTENILISK